MSLLLSLIKMLKLFPLMTTIPYPFGMTIESRSFVSEEYRFGFNGKENDKDFGEGHVDFGARIYDERNARFLSTDPLSVHFPWSTPYSFSANSPILLIDKNGESPGLPPVFWEHIMDDPLPFLNMPFTEPMTFRKWNMATDEEKATAAIAIPVNVAIDYGMAYEGGVNVPLQVAGKHGRKFMAEQLRLNLNFLREVPVVAKSFSPLKTAFYRLFYKVKNWFRGAGKEYSDLANNKNILYSNPFPVWLRNIFAGRKWEKEGVEALKKKGGTFADNQVRLVPQNGKGNIKGNRTDTDALEQLPNGNYIIHEFKLRLRTLLSRGQKASKE